MCSSAIRSSPIPSFSMPFLQLTSRSAPPIRRRSRMRCSRRARPRSRCEDAGDDPVLEPPPGTTPLWPRVQIKALFDATAIADDVLAALRDELAQPLPPAHVRALADRAWEREWLKDFRPMRFGRRLWICPGGQRPPDLDARLTTASALPDRARSRPRVRHRHASDDGAVPGMARWRRARRQARHRLRLRLRRARDRGAEARCGAVLAIDIDPQALLATRDNATRNRRRGTLDGQPGRAKLDRRRPTSCWRTSLPNRWWSWRRPSQRW